MLTLFSIPKPFTDDESEVHQANSVDSWRRTGARVLLFGDRSIEDAASRLDVEYGGDLPTTSRGTPLVNEAFVAAKRLSDTPLLCYSNADIIFFPNLMDVCRLLPTSDFLMTGRRTNLDVGERVTDEDLSVLLERASEDGQLSSGWAMDYFVWPTPMDWSMPSVAVGRPDWDNWMVVEARRRRMAFIDATGAVLAVHQNHGYGHVPGGTGRSWEGPEAVENRRVLGDLGMPSRGGLDSATHLVKRGRIVPALRPKHLLARLVELSEKRPVLARPLGFLTALTRHLKRR